MPPGDNERRGDAAFDSILRELRRESFWTIREVKPLIRNKVIGELLFLPPQPHSCLVPEPHLSLLPKNAPGLQSFRNGPTADHERALVLLVILQAILGNVAG